MLRVSAIALSLSVTIGVWSAPALAKPSTFPQSCTNTSFASTPKLATLRSTCKTVHGVPKPTTLNLKGVVNLNGVLTQTEQSDSSFQNSCSEIKVVTAPVVTLKANCADYQRVKRPASLVLENIENINGVLTYAK